MTSTWSDGTRGPLSICCPEGFLKEEVMEQMNKQFEGELFLFSSEGRGHFMHAGTFLSLLRGCLSTAFDKQRAKYHLKHEVAGLLLADGWTGFHAERCGTNQARLAWRLGWAKHPFFHDLFSSPAPHSLGMTLKDEASRSLSVFVFALLLGTRGPTAKT